MGFLQGSPLPNATDTTTIKDTAPAGYQQYLENLSKAGSSAIVDPTTGLPKTGEQLVAGYDPLQTQGYGQLGEAAGAYKSGLSTAATTAGKAAAGITPERIQALMNPYTSNVVQEMERLSQQNVQRNILPSMKAGFVGTGGLGSQRYAGALGQTMADIQANLLGQQGAALSKGYTEALKGALDEAQLFNTAAKTQADIAGREQELGLTGAGALTKAGAERQKYEQSKLDAPLAMATQAAGLMRGQALPLDQTRTVTGPKTRDYYQLSDLGRVSGILSLIGGAKEGKEGEGLSRILGIASKAGPAASKIINSILNPANASSSSIGQGEIDAMKQAGVYDDYQNLINSITSSSGEINPNLSLDEIQKFYDQNYYDTIFDALENPDYENIFGYGGGGV